MAICSKCSAEIIGSGKFCAACGAPAAIASAPEAPAIPAAPAAEPEIVARPASSEGVIAIHGDAIAAGAQVTIDADDLFFGIVGNKAAVQLGPGRQVLTQGCDWAVFIKARPVKESFGGDFGQVRDASGGGAKLRGFGTIEITVSNPVALAACLPSLSPADREDVSTYVKGTALQAMRDALQKGCSVLGWQAKDLLAGGKADELPGLTASAYEASARKLPGTSVRVVEVNLNGVELPAAPAQSAPQYAPAPPVGASSGGGVSPYAATTLGAPSAPAPPRPAPPRPAMQPAMQPAMPPAQGAPPPASMGYPGVPQPPAGAGSAVIAPAAVSGYGAPPHANAVAAYGSVAGAPAGWAASLPSATGQAYGPPPAAPPSAPLPQYAPPPSQPNPPPYATAPSASPYAAQPPPYAAPSPQAQNYAPSYGAQNASPYGVQAAQPYPGYGSAPVAAPYGGAASAPAYGAAQIPQASSPFAPQPQAPPPTYGAGARVLVQWADGNRYPATVQQSGNGQCLVVFPNGSQQWVDARYLTTGL